MQVTLYKRPHGNTEVINITEIKEEDAKWFEENNIPVSMEDCGHFYTVYADCGFRVADDENEETDEILASTTNGTCKDLMSTLRFNCEKAFESDRPRF